MNDHLYAALDNLSELADDERLSPALRRKIARIHNQVKLGALEAEDALNDALEMLNRNADFDGDYIGRWDD